MAEISEQLIKLEDVVDQLRLELKLLQKKAAEDQEELRFLINEVEIELQVVVTKTVVGEAGVKVGFWTVVEAGAKASGGWEKANTQTLRLKLKPVQVPPGTGTTNEDGDPQFLFGGD
ncbi:MAG: hypothetical protein H6739_06660 [Alphaproteobacteria bacterium]|nr:hypothetical protein [Alphaproteobacteria bacterium]